MRVFLWVQLVGSMLGFLIALTTLGSSAPWPRVQTHSRAVYVVRVLLAATFGIWEAWLLWGAK